MASERHTVAAKPRDMPTLIWCARECEARAQDSDVQAAQIALFGAAECFRATAAGDDRDCVATEADERNWQAEVAALAHALGIEYAPDTGPTWPGDLGSMLRAIADLQEHSRLWIDHEASRCAPCEAAGIDSCDAWDRAEQGVCHHSAQSWTSLGVGEMYCSDCESTLVEGDDGLWRRKGVQSDG